MILTSLLTSCASSPKNEGPKIPDPMVNGVSVVVYDETTNYVSMPLWYWKKIVRYFIDTTDIK